MPVRSYLSVTVGGFSHSISVLLERLESLPLHEPNEVQASVIENSYASSIVVLACALCESLVAWAEHAKRTRIVGHRTRPHIVERLRRLLLKREYSSLQLDEIFAQRDALMHGHLWKAKVRVGLTTLRFAGSPRLLSGYGNARFRSVPDEGSRCSRRLGLNLFPNRIWRRDAYIVLSTVLATALALGRRHPVRPSHIHFHVREGTRMRGMTAEGMERHLRDKLSQLDVSSDRTPRTPVESGGRVG